LANSRASTVTLIVFDPEPTRGRLLHELAAATKDSYERYGKKAARDYPRKKRENPPGPPKIQSASTKERLRAKQLKEKFPLAA
jgi:hypothetical protein